MSIPLRVLIVEDSEDDALLLVRDLRRIGYDPTWERVDTASSTKAALTKQTWDMVFADYYMPRFGALDALDLVQETDMVLPFVIVSAMMGEDTAVSAIKAGAHDWVMKGDLARLNTAVERELRQAEVRRAWHRAKQEEHRLHLELEERNIQLEQRVMELTALNKLFQDHLVQRFAVVQAYQEILEGLQILAHEAGALAERAREHQISDLDDIPVFISDEV